MNLLSPFTTQGLQFSFTFKKIKPHPIDNQLII